MSGKLLGIVKPGMLVAVDGKCVTVANKVLDKISVCLPREIAVAQGDKLHLKANRKLASGARVMNGELVTLKLALADGKIELTDGRILEKSFREFLPGYAVTSYGSQGKTVDYVLFFDSTIKAAASAQRWYVTISCGRRGVRIFTPDKEQLRENLTRCLRVELTAICLLVLPLDQFVFAELTGDDREQKLRLVFATHEILISGHVLRRIETAICRRELSGPTKLPEKYHALIAENQPKIRKIVVTENKLAGLQTQTALN